MKGSCLCGGVEFEVDEIVGPFELCHCQRCRKASGSAYATFLEVKTEGYQVVRGRELIRTYSAPLIDNPPPYEVWFCSRCGSPVPDPSPDGEIFEIAAGLLDEPLHIAPDKHVFVDHKAQWDHIDKPLPQFTKQQIRDFRERFGRVAAPPLESAEDPPG